MAAVATITEMSVALLAAAGASLAHFGTIVRPCLGIELIANGLNGAHSFNSISNLSNLLPPNQSVTVAFMRPSPRG
jgi:hypothetical protein